MRHNLRSRILPVCSVLALSACGTVPSSDGPPKLLLADSERAAANVESVSKRAWVEYRVVGSLSSSTKEATVWEVTPLVLDTAKQRLTALASHIGLTGEPTQPGDPYTWVIGSQTGDASSLTMTLTSHEAWWHYSANLASAQSCAIVPPPPASTPSATRSSGPPAPCAAPEPARNLPTRADAESKLDALITAAGESRENFAIDVTADDWGVYVTAQKLAGTTPTPYTWSANYGENGVLVSASGSFASFIDAGSYPLVRPRDAVSRLTAWTIATRPADLMGRIGDRPQPHSTASDSAETSDLATESPTQSAISQTPTPSSGADSSDSDAATVDQSAPTDPNPTLILTITGVRLSLLDATLSDGRKILLPAYTFTNDEGDVASTFAVADEFIEVRPYEPADVLDRTTAPPANDYTPPMNLERARLVLIGQTEKDAEWLAKNEKWVIRIVERDGQALPLTKDFVKDRLNLVVSGGVITAVTAD